jgi:hypothetical protein
MTRQTLFAAALAAAIIPASQVFLAQQAFAKGPAPLVPSALVEDVKSASTDVEFMDYVGPGQVIQLQPQDVLVLSYLKSCEHETITGGTVRIGADKSEVDGGKVARAKVRCNGGKMRLSSAESNASAASAFRLQSAAVQPVLYGLSPVIQLPKVLPQGQRTLVVERTDRGGERHEIALASDVAGGSFVDLEKLQVTPLARGGVYSVSVGSRKMLVKIDAKAKTGKTPVVSRLVRFPPG